MKDYNKIITTVNSLTQDLTVIPDQNDVIIIDTSNTRIGINTLNPRYSIDVRGIINSTNLHIEGQTTIQDISAKDISCRNISAEILDISKLTVKGTSFVQDISAKDISAHTLNIIGNVRIEGDLTLVGVQEGTETGTVEGDTYFQKNVTVLNELSAGSIRVRGKSVLQDISAKDVSCITISAETLDVSNLTVRYKSFLQDISAKDISCITISAETLDVSNLTVRYKSFLQDISAKDISCITISAETLDISKLILRNLISLQDISAKDISCRNIHAQELDISKLTVKETFIVTATNSTINSSIVEISALAITVAKNLQKKNDLSNNPSGIDVSNIASIKYNGSNWTINGGDLSLNKSLNLIDISNIKFNNSYNDGYNLFNILNTKSDISKSAFSYPRTLFAKYKIQPISFNPYTIIQVDTNPEFISKNGSSGFRWQNNNTIVSFKYAGSYQITCTLVITSTLLHTIVFVQYDTDKDIFSYTPQNGGSNNFTGFLKYEQVDGTFKLRISASGQSQITAGGFLTILRIPEFEGMDTLV